MDASAPLFPDRLWIASYREGVPASIDDDLARRRSLVELFEDCTSRFADRTAFVSFGHPMTYRELAAKARAFTAWLQENGTGPGGKVAIMLPNTPQYPVCLFGTLLAGAAVVNVNPLYTARELTQQLRDSGAEVLVVLENFAHTAEQALSDTAVKHVVVTGIGDLLGVPKGPILNLVLRRVRKAIPPFHLPRATRLATALQRGARLPFRRADPAPEDIAFLQYTGGTTGAPKAAMLTHRNILANLLQVTAWMGNQLSEEGETNVTLLPLYHIYSLTVNLLQFMSLGARNILVANPRDPDAVARTLRRERFTFFAGLNTLFRAYLENPAFRALDFSALKLSFAGGMATNPDIAARWQAMTGKPLVEGYGLTECAPVVSTNRIDPDHPEEMEFTGSIGLPLPSTEVRMRRPDGSWADLNEAGELCVRGPQVMKGYWRKPEETARVLDAEGWFATGDIGVMDERGQIRLIDRLKDMILVSGFNVYPSEVEGVVLTHPDVRECAVFGVGDPACGERVKLVVVPRSPALTEAALIAHCRANLTSYKVPKIVEFRDEELPKSNVGKILRRVLRDGH